MVSGETIRTENKVSGCLSLWVEVDYKSAWTDTSLGGDGTVLYLHRSGSCTAVCICQNLQTWALIRMNFAYLCLNFLNGILQVRN